MLQDGSTAIHLSSWKGHAPVLEYLLQSGANVDAVSSNGETALHEAARNGRESCCKILMRRGASLSALNLENQTPADVALHNNHQSTADLVSPDPKEVQREKQIKVLQIFPCPQSCLKKSFAFSDATLSTGPKPFHHVCHCEVVLLSLRYPRILSSIDSALREPRTQVHM